MGRGRERDSGLKEKGVEVEKGKDRRYRNRDGEKI